jgi:hypothetical protein
MQIVLQTAFIILWIAGLILLVIGIWYAGSWLVLVAVSKLIPLTGRHAPSDQDQERP